jgi:hypothetical protein
MAGRVPAGPVEVPPRGFVPEAAQAGILAEVLAGVELGPGTGRSRDRAAYAEPRRKPGGQPGAVRP